MPIVEPNKFKSIATVLLILSAGFLACLFTVTNVSDAEKIRTADGVLIDFGELENEWYPTSNTSQSVREFLDSLSETNKIVIVWENDRIKKINDTEADATHSWDLWVVNKGETEYHKLDSYSQPISNYTVNNISYTESGSKPLPTVDYLGNSVVGLGVCNRSVSLSPSITEILCYLNALGTIIGSDSASDYPDSFIEKKNRGEVETVADFLSVSVEKIISINPNIVFFDGSATNTLATARQFNNTTSIASVVLFPGTTSLTILKNILLVGMALGDEYKPMVKENVWKLYTQFDAVKEKGSESGVKKTGVVIMSDINAKDWAAGWDTIVKDIFSSIGCDNGFDYLVDTWAEINPEELQKVNPDFIIVISSSYKGSTGYSQMLSAHSSTWQGLKAYSSGEIYLLYEHANDMTSRLGPRFVQCAEIFTKIAFPDVFESEKRISKKYIGNDYTDFLDITKGEI